MWGGGGKLGANKMHDVFDSRVKMNKHADQNTDVPDSVKYEIICNCNRPVAAYSRAALISFSFIQNRCVFEEALIRGWALNRINAVIHSVKL